MRRIGDVEIVRVEETLGPRFDPAFIFPDWRQDLLDRHRDWMVPNFYDEATRQFISSVHTWVVRTRHHVILVDTCAGNAKQRPLFPNFSGLDTPYLARLLAAGVRPEDVDYVLCTHLHVDHVGWNTRLADGRWVPTFPRAKYVFSRVERDYWDPQSGAGGRLPVNENVFADSVQPILEAGQDLVIDGTHEIGDAFRIEPAPGHTPGHTIMKVASKGEHGVFSGDVMHQPVQIYEPSLNTRFCLEPARAEASRRSILAHCACSRALLLPAHFGAPPCGRVGERGGRFTFECRAS